MCYIYGMYMDLMAGDTFIVSHTQAKIHIYMNIDIGAGNGVYKMEYASYWNAQFKLLRYATIERKPSILRKNKAWLSTKCGAFSDMCDSLS